MRIQKYKNLIIVTLFFFLGACSSFSSHEYDLAPYADQGNTYAIPNQGNTIIGQNAAVPLSSSETPSNIAKRYDVGALEMQDANPGVTSGGLIFPTRVIVPRQYILPPKKYWRGIVINIAEMRLFYFDRANGTVMTAPVAVGREGWRTPLGKTYVYRKQESPSWNVPKSVRDEALNNGEILPSVVPPGPDNPLGDYAIYLGLRGYLIHGTNNSASIGRLVSSGCIRMYNNDVLELYDQVKKGMPVYIVYYPNKVGWRNNRLYLESHKSIPHQEGIYQEKAIPAQQLIEQAIAKRPGTQINWRKVNRVLRKQTGIPTVIGVDANA